MKKVLYVILGILSIIGLHLTIRFLLIQKFISLYNEGTYNITILNVLQVINIPDSYIPYFYKGNIYYKTKDYDNAIIEYEKAIERAPKSKICKVKNNLALTKLELIDYEDQSARSRLIEVQEILLGNGCATEDGDGRDDNSQKLYDQIEDLLNQQQQQQQQQEQKDDKDNPPPEQNEQEKQVEQQLEEKLRQDQENAAADREENLNGNNEYNYDYKKKTW